MTYTTGTPEETIEVGKTLASTFSGGEVLCLYGELGAGKTTLTTGIIQHFLPDKRVLSPTFTLVRQYDFDGQIRHIYHIDLYRMGSEKEIMELGIAEWMHDPSNIVVIEWPERLGSLMPSKRWDIHCTMVDDEKHKIVIEVV
jgi:tRNA threonylcarbamoyladenosine biosynthesis protein TsaE